MTHLKHLKTERSENIQKHFHNLKGSLENVC